MKYRPSDSSDVAILQQMVQGTSLSSMQFNPRANIVNLAEDHIIYLAEDHHMIVGIATGVIREHLGIKTIEIGENYLRNHWDNAANEQALETAMVDWAHAARGVEFYKPNMFATPQPVAAYHYIPAAPEVAMPDEAPQSMEIPAVAADTPVAEEPQYRYA